MLGFNYQIKMVIAMDHLKVANFLNGKLRFSFFSSSQSYMIILFYSCSEPLHGIFVPFKKIVMAWTS